MFNFDNNIADSVATFHNGGGITSYIKVGG